MLQEMSESDQALRRLRRHVVFLWVAMAVLTATTAIVLSAHLFPPPLVEAEIGPSKMFLSATNLHFTYKKSNATFDAEGFSQWMDGRFWRPIIVDEGCLERALRDTSATLAAIPMRCVRRAIALDEDAADKPPP